VNNLFFILLNFICGIYDFLGAEESETPRENQQPVAILAISRKGEWNPINRFNAATCVCMS